jgi:hypothetical protein
MWTTVGIGGGAAPTCFCSWSSESGKKCKCKKSFCWSILNPTSKHVCCASPGNGSRNFFPKSPSWWKALCWVGDDQRKSWDDRTKILDLTYRRKLSFLKTLRRWKRDISIYYLLFIYVYIYIHIIITNSA